PSMTGETEVLLRSRLQSAATFLAIGYAVFFAFNLLERASNHGISAGSLGLRMAFCAMVAGLLASQVALSYRQLRVLEYAFFGVLVVLSMVTQYVVGSELIIQGDLPRLVALEKNGVINLLILMVLYGLFVPNKATTTARVVLTMALGPMLVLVALMREITETG